MTTYKKPDSDAKRVHRVNATVATHQFPIKPIPALANPPKNDFRTDEDSYDGKELRPFEGRPGAMDFKKCPSRGLSV